MKRTFGLIALLACSAAFTAAPAMAEGRNDLRTTRTAYVADRGHDRDDHDRDRRDDVRYTSTLFREDASHCR
ncbi:MAG TPA: hypothetical protein VMH81_38905 [Bryobacteraceae bacterium]|nr:hypothetical protein [Bryobacteraceae bacterium]